MQSKGRTLQGRRAFPTQSRFSLCRPEEHSADDSGCAERNIRHYAVCSRRSIGNIKQKCTDNGKNRRCHCSGYSSFHKRSELLYSRFVTSAFYHSVTCFRFLVQIYVAEGCFITLSGKCECGMERLGVAIPPVVAWIFAGDRTSPLTRDGHGCLKLNAQRL